MAKKVNDLCGAWSYVVLSFYFSLIKFSIYKTMVLDGFCVALIYFLQFCFQDLDFNPD